MKAKHGDEDQHTQTIFS